MRIDSPHRSLVPHAGAGRKPAPVEPVAAVFPARRQKSAPFFGARVVLADGPIDRRVRQALEAYLSHRELLNEPVTLLRGVDTYV